MRPHFPPLWVTALRSRQEEQMHDRRLFSKKAEVPPAVEKSSRLRIDEVRRLHGEGLTDTDIAARFGVSRQIITRMRTHLRLPRNDTRGRR